VKSRIDVSVHFKPDVADERVQTVKTALLSLPEVKDVVFISPAQALETFSDLYKEDEEVIASLGEVSSNPFGAVLLIKAQHLSGYPTILSTLEEPAFANAIDGKDFDDRQAMIGRIEATSKKIEIVGFAASLLFALITLLIVFNTIRMSIYTHREEIGIMRLVGASDGFIRGPFYVEAMLWSVVSLAIALAVVYPAVAFSQPYVQRFFGSGDMDLFGFYSANFYSIFGSQLFAVAAMSFVTTKIAIAKYMKV
jgi:cell division transport system permease protein